jgi:hypothetical protein
MIVVEGGDNTHDIIAMKRVPRLDSGCEVVHAFQPDMARESG